MYHFLTMCYNPFQGPICLGLPLVQLRAHFAQNQADQFSGAV